MAKFKISAYRLLKKDAISFQIAMDIGAGSPLPSRIVEAKNLADLKWKMGAYAEEAKESGKPLMISDLIIEGRKPSGYNAAEKRGELRLFVNEDKIAA